VLHIPKGVGLKITDTIQSFRFDGGKLII